MKAAYIGILTPGSTSRMRAEWLRRLTPEWNWLWIDLDEPKQGCGRIWRSLAFRARRGPLVDAANDLVREKIAGAGFDCIWVDKGVLVRRKTLELLRENASRLVHFTLDTAFHANRSGHFYRGLDLYDLLVTTKSFEIKDYNRRVDPSHVFLTTQGYDATIHYTRTTVSRRRREAVFVGLAEPDRERCLGMLLEQGIPVRLAGIGWGRFLRKWGGCPHLHFEGAGVFGDAYATMLSGSWVGLGLLSKRFPELHTTRTFEIPACGTILATERTADTERFFSPSEALFFHDYRELGVKLKALFETAKEPELAALAEAGRQRVLTDGRDYESILASVLTHPAFQRL